MELFGQPQPLQTTDGQTILVVDDEEVIRDLCGKALADFRVLEADNGRTALDLLDRESVDLVLVDVMMPVMNGLDLLMQIKERDPDQLVIVMTGYADKEIILRALKADADDFIQKPLNLLQLKSTIEKALEKRQLRQELLQLKRLDRLKAEFLGLISHKLRTPTTVLSLFIQNLASGAVSTDTPEFPAAVAAIREEADYLAHLIQDLLTYSDVILQEQKPKLAPADLREIALTALAEKRPAAAEKGISLISTLQGAWPRLSLDRRRIAFAIGALLDNAIKFTPAGGQVILSGEAGKDGLQLVVRDTGIGIAAEELPRVFDKFYQIDPTQAGQVRGFGLGLFYARQFVQDHGGAITLESVPGAGTTVTITLPRRSPA
ncbi:MAG: hybrid sensor histidine kinase/response regulator [Deltaproteobacteria bacterium]|nr:MAG: hybrid sensor histidine kinase/response regulator [Deltaproteobacteria bacterium]